MTDSTPNGGADQPIQPAPDADTANETKRGETGTADGGPVPRDPRVHELLDDYWRKNLGVMRVLLAVWAFAGLGCGVLFADWLNALSIGGIPLGFWFAQQGSIIVFVVLILIYCVLLNRLDAKHHEQLEALRREGGGSQ